MKASTTVPTATRGSDAGKKIVGRKRGIVTDTLGLPPAVVVTAAAVSDTLTGTHLLDQAATAHPSLAKTWVDAGFTTRVVAHGAWASTSRSSPRPRRSQASVWSNDGGSSNAAWAGRCTTAAWPATTKPGPTTPPG